MLVDRLGADDAPGVAQVFLAHTDPWYVRKGHPVDILLADAEKLHMEWQRGAPITRGDAEAASRDDEMRAQSARVAAILRKKTDETT
jgi:hypothetical protein